MSAQENLPLRRGVSLKSCKVVATTPKIAPHVLEGPLLVFVFVFLPSGGRMINGAEREGVKRTDGRTDGQRALDWRSKISCCDGSARAAAGVAAPAPLADF